MERDFLKYVYAQNLQNPTQFFIDPMNLIETGHHEVHAHSDPDLGTYSVLAGAVESLDAEVLLDPLEKSR